MSEYPRSRAYERLTLVLCILVFPYSQIHLEFMLNPPSYTCYIPVSP